MKTTSRLVAMLLALIMMTASIPSSAFAIAKRITHESTIDNELEESELTEPNAAASDAEVVVSESDASVLAPEPDDANEPELIHPDDASANPNVESAFTEESDGPARTSTTTDETNSAPTTFAQGTATARIQLIYDENSDGNLRDIVYTPDETGYYELCFSGVDEEGETVVYNVEFYENNTYLGHSYLGRGYSVGGEEYCERCSLYMAKGSKYRLKLGMSRGELSDAFVTFTKYSDKETAEMFIISDDGVLEEYTGNLINVRIPEGVKSVAGSAYKSMSQNNRWHEISVYFPSTFESVTGEELNRSWNFWDTGYAMNSCSYTINSKNSNYKSVNGVIYSKDGKTLIAAPRAAKKYELNIPEGTTVIDEYAFASRYGYYTVTLPESLKIIEEHAFLDSTVQNIEFGSNLEEIKEFAFDYSHVKSLIFPEKLKYIGDGAFNNCEELKEVTFTGETYVDSSFRNEALEKININANIVVSSDVFYSCSSVKTVKIGKAATEWKLKEKCLVNYYDSKNHPGQHDDYYDDDKYNGTHTTLVLVMSDYDSKSFVMADDIEEVGAGAFSSIEGIKELTVGKSCNNLEIKCDLQTIKVAKGNKTFFVEDNILYKYHYNDHWNPTVDGWILVKYPMNDEKEKLTIPDKVVELESGCFEYFSSKERPLKYVVTHEKIKYISSNIFYTQGIDQTILTIEGFEDSPMYEYYEQYKYQDYLEWKTRPKQSYKVTLDPNGGTVSSKTITRPKDQKVGSLPKPTKSGRSFMGWYTKKTGGSKITANTVVKGNVKYYAHWAITVKFNANGGKASKASIKVTENTAIGTLPTATKKNMYFIGWYTSKSGGTKISSKTKIKSSKTYYAHWSKPEIGNAKVTVNNCIWDGEPQKPTVTVTLNGTSLKKDKDFSVSYENNKEPSKKAKAIVKGKGQFAGSKKSKTVYFTIDKAPQKITAKNVTYKAGLKGKTRTLSVTVKENAKLNFSSNSDGIKVTGINTGKIKLVSPVQAKITIKSKGTKHYKAGKKTITVILQGTSKDVQDSASLNCSNLTYNKNDKVYSLSREVFNSPISVKVNGNISPSYRCTIEKSGNENEVWVEKGNFLTARGKGEFKIKAVLKKNKVYPASTVVFTINMNGMPLKDIEFLYRETDDYKVDILEYIGKMNILTVPTTIKIANKNRDLVKISDRAFANREISKLEFEDPSNGSGITSIGKSAFASCKALVSVRLPSGLTSIGNNAFDGCSNLELIFLPNSVKTIGDGAFRGCMNFEGSMYLPGSLTSIGNSAFENCFNISRLVVYSDLKTVGSNAFKNTSGIKEVYYSASKSLWNRIKFGSGNDSITSIKPLCNVGAGVDAYSASGIKTKTLLRDAPEYLMNPSYEFLTKDLMADVMTQLYSEKEWKITLSALKTQMKEGLSFTVESLFDDIFANNTDGITFKQEKLEKILALELICEVVEADDAVPVKEKYIETFNTVYEIAGELKGYGDDNIFKDNQTRWDYARKLAGCFKGRQASDINNMLKKIQPYWQPDKNNPKSFTIQGIYDKAGKAIDVTDYIITVILLNELCRDYLNSIMPYLPEDSSLYRGFIQLKQQMDQPLADFIAYLLTVESTELLTKLTIKEGSKAFGFSEPTLKVAEIFYKVWGSLIDVPTIDDYNNAWLSLSNAMTLNLIFDNVNRRLIDNKGKDTDALEEEQKLIAMMYFESVAKAVKYCKKTMNDPAYLQWKFDRYKDGLNYDAYILSCKENLVETGQYR